MSQYPSPYPPPAPPYSGPPIDFSYYQPPQADLLAPARRAAILQACLGTFLLACGICVGSFMWIVDLEQMAAQANMNIQEMTQGQSIESIRRVNTVTGTIGTVVGIALLVLAWLVRRGGVASAVTSIVLCSLVTVGLGLQLVASLVLGLANPAVAVCAVVMLGIPLALFALNVFWLVGAARNSSQVGFAQQQYQAQYYQYQQQQQAYGQAGAYGAAYPPPGYGYPPQQPQQQGYYPPPGQSIAPVPAPPPQEMSGAAPPPQSGTNEPPAAQG